MVNILFLVLSITISLPIIGGGASSKKSKRVGQLYSAVPNLKASSVKLSAIQRPTAPDPVQLKKRLFNIISHIQQVKLSCYEDIMKCGSLLNEAKVTLQSRVLPLEILDQALIASVSSYVTQNPYWCQVYRQRFRNMDYLSTIIKLLVESGANIHCNDDAPLIYAAHYSYDVFNLILELGYTYMKPYRLSVFRKIITRQISDNVRELCTKYITYLQIPQMTQVIPVQIELLAENLVPKGFIINREFVQRVIQRLDMSQELVNDDLINAVLAERDESLHHNA